MREGRVWDVFWLLKWVVTLYDELQHFEATADAHPSLFVVHVVLLCNRESSWKSLWNAEKILKHFYSSRSILTVSFCYLLFTNFTFLKNQYMMVEYKGALDEISKTFRSVETWYDNLTLI